MVKRILRSSGPAGGVSLQTDTSEVRGGNVEPQAALHVATNAARFDEVLAGAGSIGSQARIRSTSGAGLGHWL